MVSASVSARPTWTAIQHDGPDHLGLWSIRARASCGWRMNTGRRQVVQVHRIAVPTPRAARLFLSPAVPWRPKPPPFFAETFPCGPARLSAGGGREPAALARGRPRMVRRRPGGKARQHAAYGCTRQPSALPTSGHAAHCLRLHTPAAHELRLTSGSRFGPLRTSWPLTAATRLPPDRRTARSCCPRAAGRPSRRSSGRWPRHAGRAAGELADWHSQRERQGPPFFLSTSRKGRLSYSKAVPFRVALHSIVFPLPFLA